MSIQRYESYDAWEADEYEGRYVLYADHVAAVAEADDRAFNEGIADERARIKAAVQALAPIDQRVDENGFVSLVYDKGEVLAIIDGEQA